ncbi:MAG TPA: ribonuclease HII [Terracidiphilus sp.]|nr:ribonuclease HII [Terracidiphilus sp.]
MAKVAVSVRRKNLPLQSSVCRPANKRRSAGTPVCSWKLEKFALQTGALRVAGLDEVGRGPMFGPVVAAAVILDRNTRFRGLTDSKKLNEAKRVELDVQIRAKAIAWAIAAVDVETIDRINIRRASLLAMRLAVEQLSIAPDYLLIDGIDTIDWPCPQRSVIQGDGTSYSIAAASIIAKVHRDALIVELDRQYPGYGLASHKGYCSREHLNALAKLGPTPLHRKNWSPVAQQMFDFPDFAPELLDPELTDSEVVELLES